MSTLNDASVKGNESRKVKLATFFTLAAAAVFHSVGGCDSSAGESQGPAASTTQPTSQPARGETRSIMESHGTIGDIPEASGGSVFIHMVTPFEENDNPACVAFNAALAARKAGRPVVMFFDAGAVTDLKIWHGAPTALRYELPEKLRQMLSRRYSVAVDEWPSTYQELLYSLHDAGVSIAANGFMAELVSLTDDPATPGQLEPIVEMWSLDQLIEHRKESSLYLRY